MGAEPKGVQLGQEEAKIKVTNSIEMAGVAETMAPLQSDLDSPESSAKRRQIMEGAKAVFLAAGFDGASMNDVARVAGVSKGTLYVYFDSKEKLFEALIREERRQQAERIAVLAWEGDDVRTALRDFGCKLLEMMARPENVAHVRTVIAASGKFPQLGRAFFEAGPCFGANCLAGHLRRQTERGLLRIVDFETAAWQFLELMQGGAFKQLLFAVTDELAPERIRQVVEAGVAVFMAAYAVPGAEAHRDLEAAATASRVRA
ncbi:MAG TPA: TetR/AcrR family transcriptional regulator [Roseiarcus sp.]|nr:TetR/AcrR family transcriptional regulator [Roseiarcus sp.]